MAKDNPTIGDIWLYVFKRTNKPPVLTYHLLISKYNDEKYFKSLCLTDGESGCMVEIRGKSWQWVA